MTQDVALLDLQVQDLGFELNLFWCVRMDVVVVLQQSEQRKSNGIICLLIDPMS